MILASTVGGFVSSIISTALASVPEAHMADSQSVRAVRVALAMVLGLLLSIIVPAALADDGIPGSFDADQIGKDMARMRSQMEAIRARNVKSIPGATAAKAARKRRTSGSLRAPQPSSTRSEPRSDSRRTQAMGYRFSQGQTFGYHVEIAFEESLRSIRYAGSPVFSVRSIDNDRGARMLALAKLSYFSKVRGSSEEVEKPDRALWLGSLITVDPSGSVRGKKDVNGDDLPDFLILLVSPKELIFPDLTASITGVRSDSTSATLVSQNRSKSTVEGKKTRSVQSTPLSGSLIQVRAERGFTSTENSPYACHYVSNARFDRDRGLVLDSTAVCTSEQGGSSNAVKINVRLLGGDELKRAVDQANQDWVHHPAELEPRELSRIRLDVQSLPRLKSTKDVRPGMMVAHFQYDDDRWYLADVLEVVSERNNQVKIRYRGSNEVLEVQPGQLAIPPAALTAAK